MGRRHNTQQHRRPARGAGEIMKCLLGLFLGPVGLLVAWAWVEFVQPALWRASIDRKRRQS